MSTIAHCSDSFSKEEKGKESAFKNLQCPLRFSVFRKEHEDPLEPIQEDDGRSHLE